MANRIAVAIAAKQAELDGKLTADKIEGARVAFDMELDEFAMFQELKSLAVVNNLLTLDEGNTVYGYLGNTTSHFNGQTCAVKVILTSLFKELLGKRIAMKRKAAR